MPQGNVAQAMKLPRSVATILLALPLPGYATPRSHQLLPGLAFHGGTEKSCGKLVFFLQHVYTLGPRGTQAGAAGEGRGCSVSWLIRGQHEPEANDVALERRELVVAVGRPAVAAVAAPSPAAAHEVRARGGPCGSVTFPVGYVPYQSRHHSDTFPCMSYRPHAFGG